MKSYRAMQDQDIVCESCRHVIPLTPDELTLLIEALVQGDREKLRCPHCGASLAGPIQQVTGVKAPKRLAGEPATARRRHARLPLDRQVRYYVLAPSPTPPRPGRILDLSDGGLRLIAREALPPSTQVALEIATGSGERLLIGTVIWNNASLADPKGTVEHGVQFAEEIPGAATVLFLQEFLSGGPATGHPEK